VGNLEKANRTFNVAQVYEWVEDNQHLQGCFQFFDVYNPNSDLYCRVIRPLLSMRTTGFIDVERVAKPFKNNMLRKERNRLSDEKGRILFQAAQDLRYLMRVKRMLRGSLHDDVAVSIDID
jgi:hypothetical protein